MRTLLDVAYNLMDARYGTCKARCLRPKRGLSYAESQLEH